jgi:hypothetical protein
MENSGNDFVMLLRRYLFGSFAFLFGAAWALAGTLFVIVGLATGDTAVNLIGFVFALVGWYLVIRSFRNIRRAVELLRSGAIVQGQVTGIEIDHYSRNNRHPRRYFTYCFTAPEDGSARKGRSPNLPLAMEEQWKTGDAISVAYDSRNPSLSEADIYGARQSG